jgi:hypothetical protein
MALIVNPKRVRSNGTELNLIQESNSGFVAAWVDDVISRMQDR